MRNSLWPSNATLNRILTKEKFLDVSNNVTPQIQWFARCRDGSRPQNQRR
jgi:hypothetical protein